MTYTYELQPADLQVARSAAARLCRKIGGATGWGFVINLTAWAFIGAGVMAMLDGGSGRVQSNDRSLGVVLVVIGIALAFAGLIYMGKRTGAALASALEPFPIACSVTLVEDGVTFSSRNGIGTVAWRGIQDVFALPHHVAVVLRPYNVSVIPNKAFPDATERDAFVQQIRARIV